MGKQEEDFGGAEVAVHQSTVCGADGGDGAPAITRVATRAYRVVVGAYTVVPLAAALVPGRILRDGRATDSATTAVHSVQDTATVRTSTGTRVVTKVSIKRPPTNITVTYIHTNKHKHKHKHT